MIDGVKLKLRDGAEYVIPSLCAADARSCQAEVNRLVKLDHFYTQEDLDAICKVVHLALRENYPRLTLEDVERLVDYANAQRVAFVVLFGAVGLKRVASEKAEAKKPGEAERQ